MKIYETMDNGIQIVEYEDSLAATLADMWNKSKEDWGGDSGLKTAANVRARAKSQACYNVYIAMDGETAVGYCSLSRYFGDADTLYIGLLGVRPDYQGKKIGKALVNICTQRTIELGYPRIDLHTWGGNTAAVPLYKKCGYLWEDRPDSTHLVNFIPQIITTPLFADYFAKADWYTDSTRTWDTVPDGVKVNKFEFFGYTWEKDGAKLEIGYERTGRQIRLIETDDYRIELSAGNHELAFGQEYGCEFTVTNKTGAPLRVALNGQNDGNIAFDFAADEEITGTRSFPAKFFVGEIDEPQDKWKVHPCVLAGVTINGHSVKMGLGIEPRYPLTVKTVSESKLQTPGTDGDLYISITSALASDAVVAFELPANDLADFDTNRHRVEIKAGGKASSKVNASWKAAGYRALPITYTITPADGEPFTFTRILHFIARDLTAAFYEETDTHYAINNGPWQVHLHKSDGEADIEHLLNYAYKGATFEPPKLGKPYDEEFNLLKPLRVSSHSIGSEIFMEVEYASGKFPGIHVTQVFCVNAGGIMSRKFVVENKGGEAREMWLSDMLCMHLGTRSIFRYDGRLLQDATSGEPGGATYGVDSLDPEKFQENWIFEADAAAPRGFCWHPDLRPGLQWGEYATFELDLGNMQPGDKRETEPTLCVYGVFHDAGDFRNFARGVYISGSEEIPAKAHGILVNGGNPFIAQGADMLDIVIENNREGTMEGTYEVAGGMGAFAPATQENDDDEENCPAMTFNVPLIKRPPVEVAQVSVKTLSNLRQFNRAIFFPRGEVKFSEEGTSLACDNGEIVFKVDPAYGQVCYSLVRDGNEWMHNQYPNHQPYAWWNIYLGGIRVIPSHMNNNAVLKEKITADRVEVRDNFGNLWQGLRTTVTIHEDEELRGGIYESYYVTQPGLPVLAAFYRFVNHTGIYRKDVPEFDFFLQIDDDMTKARAELTEKTGQRHSLLLGNEDCNANFRNTVQLFGTRKESLYLFHANAHNGKSQDIFSDNKVPCIASIYMEAPAAPSETFTSSPAFMVFSDTAVPGDGLDGLERVSFVNGELRMEN